VCASPNRMNTMRSVNELRVPHAPELTTTVGLVLMAGFTFNMSIVTAPALNALSPEQALAAWKGINFTVRNPLFPATAFGTALLVVACAALAWRSRLRVWCLSFALLHIIGVIGTTAAVENGINNGSSRRPSPLRSRPTSVDLACRQSRPCTERDCSLRCGLAWVSKAPVKQRP